MIALEQKKLTLFQQGLKDCVPTLFGYLSVGFACGVICKTAGLSLWQVIGMSALIYAGSSQFIAASLIMTMAPVSSIVTTIFLVNLRHLLMSAAMAPYFTRHSLWKNALTGALLTDETFALASTKGNHSNSIPFEWMQGVNIIAYLNWILATAIGALFSDLIPDYKEFGLDYALVAMFIGLLISCINDHDQVKRALLVGLSTVVILLLLLSFVSANTAVLIAAISGALIGVVSKQWI